MARVESPEVPALGEPVLFWWGLRSVPGHVAEVYPSHPSPRVVVLMEPGVAGDHAATISVPLDDIEPGQGAESEWATTFRYEVAVAAALGRLDATAQRCAGADRGADLLVAGPDGPIAVQVKRATRPATPRALVQHGREALRHLPTARGVLVVTDADVAAHEPSPGVRVVRWRDEKDDPALAVALAELRESPTPG